jgi:ribosomal protein S18 acetylase RimI-like enzyme
MTYRKILKESDLPAIREILSSSGYFYDDEIDIAIELAQENLELGDEKSGYRFVLADIENIPVGYACYGKIPGTKDSYDLYWIAVHEDHRGARIGKTLLNMVEDHITELSGKHIWIETSSRPLYLSTRMFYQKMGYRIKAELPDFYGMNDDKIIYMKRV